MTDIPDDDSDQDGQENQDVANKDDDFEKERWRALGRGYNHMTDAEVAADIRRRINEAKKPKGGKR